MWIRFHHVSFHFRGETAQTILSSFICHSWNRILGPSFPYFCMLVPKAFENQFIKKQSKKECSLANTVQIVRKLRAIHILHHLRGWGPFDFCDKLWQGVGGLFLECDVTFCVTHMCLCHTLVTFKLLDCWHITRFFYKEPTSRPSSKSSLFIDLKSANCSTKSSLLVP